MVARLLPVALSLMLATPALAQSSSEWFTNQKAPTPGLSITKSQKCDADGKCRSMILVKGDFTSTSGADLTQALEKMKDSRGDIPANIYLDSPGGVLSGALSFGAVVRASGLNTVLATNARCFSACAYAFLGGVARVVEPGAQYGVHRFFAKEEVRGGVEMSQQTMAMLGSFVENMGASPDLVRLSASAGQQSMVVLRQDQIQALRIDNTFPTPTPWSIQTSNDALEMTVAQRSAFNDREVRLLISPSGNHATIKIGFTDPKAHSSRKTQAEIQAYPLLSLCRIDLRTQKVRKCIEGKVKAGWQPDPTRPRSFAAEFSVGLRELSSLTQGDANERIVVEVKPNGRVGSIVLVATSVQGFSTALNAIIR